MIVRSAWIVAGLVLLALASWGLFAWRSAAQTAAGDKEEEQPAAATGVVRLSEAKREAAGIQVVAVERQRVRHFHQVPGRLQYDDRRHVEIRSATDCTIQSWHVKPGDRVETGQALAVLSSPEIGTARADVLQRQAEWEIAAEQLAWRQQTDRNLRELVSEIRSRRPIEVLESQFGGRPLGEFRERLVAPYSRLLLAQSLVASIQDTAGTGALAARTLRERRSDRETAEAALRSACEQTVFDSRLKLAEAEAAVQDAARRRDIARQHLTALLGYEAPLPETPADSRSGTAKAEQSPPDRGLSGLASSLSLVECRAPFAGTIESQRFAVSERVARGDTLLVLADTSHLWAVADVREQDWSALTLAADEELELEFPAIPDLKRTGKLHYLGREVMPDTNAIPLVTVVENSDQRLRPGLYVRLSVPLGPPREAIVVPAAAVVEHEGAKFVFVPESQETYRRRDVQTGEATEEWVEIVAGVAAGELVVGSGAFYLKSELLLEREE